MDFTPYSYISTTPYKKGLRERVSRENIEDLYIPVIEDQLRRLARRMAYTIDADCMTVIQNAAGAAGGVGGASANIFSAGGGSLSATGAYFTVAGTLGTKDLLKAKSVLETYNLEPDALLMNPVNSRDVMFLPQFSLWGQFGHEEVAGQPPIQNGKIGSIFGMDVTISNVVPAGTAFAISTGKNMSAAYSPLGFFVIKRPLMSDVEIKKEFDSVDVTLTTRYAPVVTYGEAIVEIQGLATS